MPLCINDSVLKVSRIHTDKYAKQSAALEINRDCLTLKDCQTALKPGAALITKTKKGVAPFVPLEKVDNFLQNLDIFVGKVGFVAVFF